MHTPHLILAARLNPSVSVLRSLAEFPKVRLVFSLNNFYIHNGVDTLVVLSGDADITATADELIASIVSTGDHIAAEANSLDDALDMYNLWLKKPVAFVGYAEDELRLRAARSRP